jgi:hypothetical protein
MGRDLTSSQMEMSRAKPLFIDDNDKEEEEKSKEEHNGNATAQAKF